MALKESYYTSADGITGNFGADAWYAMSFTATSDYLIGSVKNRVWRIGAVDPGVVTVSIRAANASTQLSTGADLLSTTVVGTTFPTADPSADLTNSGGALLITFSTSIAISNGQTYAVVYRCVNTGTMRQQRRSSTLNSYAGGRNGTSTDAGVNWVGTYGEYADNQFAIYSATTAVSASGTISSKSSGTAAVTGGTAIPTAAETVNLIPFVYSSDVVYMVELGNEYMRFFYGDEVLLDETGDEVWLETPYLTEHLYELQFKQIGDVMRITHPAYQPRTLRRTSETSFDLQVIPFSTGPFLVRHDIDSDDGITLASSISGELNGTVSYRLSEAWDGYGIPDGSKYGTNHIQDNWWDGTAAHALGSGSDYCGGGRMSDGRTVWITYTIEFPTPIASLDEITLAYICMSWLQGSDLSANTYTKRGLRVYNNVTEEWTVVIDPADASSDFEATTYVNKPPTLVGHYDTTTIAISPAVENVSKIEIFLFALSNYRSTACALFDVTAGAGISTRTGTLIASSSLFQDGHIGSLFQLVQPRDVTTSNGSVSAPVTEDTVIGSIIGAKGEFRFNTSGSWTGTIKLQRRENSLSEDDWEEFRSYTSGDPPDFNVNYPFIEDNYNVEYRMVVSSLAAGSITGTITVTDSMQTGIVRIDDVESDTVADITIITPVASTDPTKRWAEGAWSGVRNYPASCTFIEERCVYAGMNLQTSGAKLLKVWLSHSADYDNFDAGVNAADSFEVTIPTTETISWIEAMDNLTVATGGDTWFIRSNKIDSPLVPVPSPIVRSQSGYSCDPIQPVDGGKAMLYVSGRQVRELGYEKEAAQFDADLTALAEHFTESPIVGISMQYDPYQILWCWHEDGTLSALVYEREQNCVAWAHIIIDGEVQSVCVTPGEISDDIWLAVKRTINSEDVIYIEKIKPIIVNSDTLIEDLYYVDCGITFTSVSPTSTIAGLLHLVGETVKVLANGVVFDDALVDSSGEATAKLATVTTTITKAQVGLAYKSKVQPERIILNTPKGSSMGTIIRIPKMTINFMNSMGAKFGTTDNDQRDIDWENPAFENLSEITGLFDGEVNVIVDGGFSSQSPIIISTDAPLPMTVRALLPRIEQSGD